MARGGARTGAGRKRVEPDPIVDVEHLLRTRVPAGRRHLARRAVVALASYGAPLSEIAATVEVDVADLVSRFGDELALGSIACEANVVRELFRAGTGNGRRFSVSAAIACLQRIDPGRWTPPGHAES